MQTTPSPASSGNLNRTLTGASALGAVFTLPVAVDASVVYGGPQGVTIPPGQRVISNATAYGVETAFAPIDLNGDAINDFSIGIRQERIQFIGTGRTTADADGQALLRPLNSNAWGGVVGSEGGPFLASSSSVGSSPQNVNTAQLRVRNVSDYSTRSPGGSFSSGLPASATGVVGVRFNQPGANSLGPAGEKWGWIRLRVEDGTGGYPTTITAVEWAWETTGEPIHYPGQPVPEANPGLVLLAAGGTGLAAWRLKRRKQLKEATPQA